MQFLLDGLIKLSVQMVSVNSKKNVKWRQIREIRRPFYDISCTHVSIPSNYTTNIMLADEIESCSLWCGRVPYCMNHEALDLFTKSYESSKIHSEFQDIALHSSFALKNEPMIPLKDIVAQNISFCGCRDNATATWGFSVPQMHEFCLWTK